MVKEKIIQAFCEIIKESELELNIIGLKFINRIDIQNKNVKKRLHTVTFLSL